MPLFPKGIVQMELFPLFTAQKEPPHKTCQSCEHLTRHFYNKGYKYCTQKGSNRTAYGLEKIKSRDKACGIFLEKNKPSKQYDK